MPDFDTRKPQESSEPDRFRVQLVASKLRTLAIAAKPRAHPITNRLRSLLISVRLSTLLIGVGTVPLVVAVVVVGFPVGAYLLSAAAAQHGPNNLPQYEAEDQGDEADCFPYTTCYDVYTTATDTEVLALVADRLIIGNGYDADVQENYAVSPSPNLHEPVVQDNAFEAHRAVVFFHQPHDPSILSATAYYSGHKGPPKELMSEGSWEHATVRRDIYVVGGQSELNPYVWWRRIYGYWHRIFST
jgi:hypothetical protein